MSDHLLKLADGELREIAAAIRAGRMMAPFTAFSLQRVTSPAVSSAVAGALQQLTDRNFTPNQLATVLELLVKDRAERSKRGDVIDLVTTGPEAPGVTNRDTSVVVRELFAGAERSVLVAGYAVYQGRQVFRELADRMHDRPMLQVRMFLDVQRGPGDTTADIEIVRRFAERFKTREWPKESPLPEVFYDPRSLKITADKRACLHAKCVAVDSEAVFVSSANFTEAAQERNIEVGLLVRSFSLAQRLEHHFDALLSAGMFLPVW